MVFKGFQCCFQLEDHFSFCFLFKHFTPVIFLILSILGSPKLHVFLQFKKKT